MLNGQCNLQLITFCAACQLIEPNRHQSSHVELLSFQPNQVSMIQVICKCLCIQPDPVSIVQSVSDVVPLN